MTPKISVILPVYNAARFLPEAIDSVLRQTFTDFELIMVDDCSKDNTWDIMMDYASRDPRITLIRNVHNLGVAGARNAAHRLAKGEYIAAMDADDILMADRLALQVDYLDAHPEIGLLAGCAKRIDATGNFLSLWDIPTDHDTIRARLLFNNIIPHATVIMRRALLDQLGGYSSFFSTDYDLWWRMSSITRLAALPQTLALIRITTDPNRISFGQASKQLTFAGEMSLRIAQEIMADRPLDAEAYRRFFLSSRGKPNSLLRFDIRRLQSLWDFIAADPIYCAVTKPKLLSVALKITHSQPLEALSLLTVLNTQFHISWKYIARKYLEAYLPASILELRRVWLKPADAPQQPAPV